VKSAHSPLSSVLSEIGNSLGSNMLKVMDPSGKRRRLVLVMRGSIGLVGRDSVEVGSGLRAVLRSMASADNRPLLEIYVWAQPKTWQA
jgi:hypothetical protein